MESRARSGPGGRDDWRVRVTTGAGVAACVAGVMALGPAVGIDGFWPGMLAIAVAIGVGILLGRFAGAMLFRPSAVPPDPPPAACPGVLPDRETLGWPDGRRVRRSFAEGSNPTADPFPARGVPVPTSLLLTASLGHLTRCPGAARPRSAGGSR